MFGQTGWTVLNNQDTKPDTVFVVTFVKDITKYETLRLLSRQHRDVSREAARLQHWLALGRTNGPQRY